MSKSITSYSSLLAADIKTLPNIKLHESLRLNSDIIFNAVLDRCDSAKLADPHTRTAEVLQAYQKVKADMQYQSVFQEIFAPGSKFAQSLRQAYRLLSEDIAEDVAAITDDADAISEANPLELPENNDTAEQDATDHLTVMDWNRVLAPLGGSDAVLAYNQAVNGTKNLIFSDIIRALRGPEYQAEVLTVTPEITKEISRAVKTKFNKDATSIFKALETIKYATEPRMYNAAIHYITQLNSTNASGALVKVDEFINLSGKVVDTLTRCNFNLSDRTNHILHDNLKKVKNLTMLAGYGLMIMRNQYRNALVLNPTLVNADVVPDYNSAGGTMVDVYNYISRQYGMNVNAPFPVTGIPAKEILAARDRMKQESAHALQQRKITSAKLKHRQESSSLLAAMENYIQNIPLNQLPEYTDRRDYVRAKMKLAQMYVDRLDATPDINRDSILFDFVLDTHFPGTMLKPLHHRLSEAIVAEINKSDGATTLDNEALDDVTTDVSAEATSDFISDTLIEAVPEN